MTHWRPAAAALALVIAVPPGALAGQAPAKPGDRGVLNIEYKIDEKISTGDQYDTLNAQVKRDLKVSFNLYATDLAPSSFIDPSQNKQFDADTAAVSAQGQAAVASNAELMAKMQKMAEACGDDAACMEKAAMQMAGQADTQRQLQKMQKDAKAVLEKGQEMQANSPPRFQIWLVKEGRSGKIDGEVTIDETMHRTVYDPLCYKTNNICTENRTRKAHYALDLPADKVVAAIPRVELDTEKNVINMVLPTPMLRVKVDETTEEGTTKKDVPFLSGGSGDLGNQLEIIGASGRQGQKVVKVQTLGDYGQPATVTVSWQFHGL